MSAKASISYSKHHHLYKQELLTDEPISVFLDIVNPSEFRIEKDTFKGKATETLTVEIPTEIMDQIAVDWIKARKL
jgi:hypothetical protein